MTTSSTTTGQPTASRLNVLLCPFGSAGDVYPFVGLGKALRERGHHITLLTNGNFRELAERERIEFVELMTKQEFLQLAADPLIWDPIRGAKTVLQSLTPQLLRQTYQRVRDHSKHSNSVVLTSALGFGPRIACEVSQVPLVSIDLQPMVLWSAYRTPVMPGFLRSPMVPRWLKRLQYSVAERCLLEPLVRPTLERFRLSLGLEPMSRLTQWWHSPDCILGLYPDWYGPRQPDWPPQVRLSQFPIWNEDSTEPLPDEIVNFLEQGSPPIVFTPGSANMFGEAFFAAAVDACQRIGRRAILVSRFDHHIPATLPPTVQHIPYAPFDRVLLHAAAIVHHGGIGTTSTAMMAGIPQLIMPLSHDQPDNALRTMELGVSDQLKPKRFTGPAVAEKLQRLLSDSNVAQSCQSVATRFSGVDPFAEACQIIESCSEAGDDVESI